MNQPLMKSNWKLYIESSIPTELANIKDGEVDAEAVSMDSSDLA